MACGCKKKSSESTQQTSTIKMTEGKSSSNNQTITVQEQQVQSIIDRIKELRGQESKK